MSGRAAAAPMKVAIENCVGLATEYTKYCWPATTPQIAVFSNTIGLDTLRNAAQRTVLQVSVVVLHETIWKVIALALVIVMEPLSSVNTNAGPFADVDSTTCELLTILRTK